MPPLAKDDASNSFKGTVKLDSKDDFVFKFILNDHTWAVNQDYSIKTDEFGNENNYVSVDELTVFEEFEQGDRLDQTPEVAEPEQQQQKEQESSEGEDIQQVLTSSSSFAAVSIPSDASNFEQVEPMSKPNPAEVDPDQMETISRPNLSDSNSTLNTPRGTTVSDTPDNTHKLPGGYPVTPTSEASTGPSSANLSATNSPRKATGKKDSLVSRFRGFFK